MPNEALVSWAVVIVAFFMVVQSILWAILIFVLIVLVRKLNAGVSPVLRSARVTAANVQASGVVISEAVVQPIIRIAAFISGVRRAMAILAGFSRRRRES